MGRRGRRAALGLLLAGWVGALGHQWRTADGRPAALGEAGSPEPGAPDLPWRLLRERLLAGGPNPRLGLVQAQHIFGRVGASLGRQLVRGGLVRVRIPANLVRLGDDGWRHDRFEDGWWMERLRDIGVPFKAVVELWPRFTDEMHAQHAARLVRRTRPDVVIVGNELNAGYLRPGFDAAVEIDRYLGQYATIHAAVRAERPETRIQLYGEAYDGDPRDRDAFLRRVLAELRQRALPPPDVVGIHVYDSAEVLPARLASYRQLLAESGLAVPVSVEELGPQHGVIDAWEAAQLRRMAPFDPSTYQSRLDELRADGWLDEQEQADLVVQHMAVAAACADQAQVFCAVDFDAEISHRRGLVSNHFDRARPALAAFQFAQRLLNDVESARMAVEDGVAHVAVTRRSGLHCFVHWRTAVPPGADPQARETPAPTLEVPPYTFVTDSQGKLVLPPASEARQLPLPAATTPHAGGAVRILI